MDTGPISQSLLLCHIPLFAGHMWSRPQQICNCIFYVFVHNHLDMFVTEELSEHTKMNVSCTKNATDIIFLNEQLFMSACDEHHVQNSIL